MIMPRVFLHAQETVISGLFGVISGYSRTGRSSNQRRSAEFHDVLLFHDVQHVLFLTVSGASFLYQMRKMAPETPFTPASFLAQETCQSERGLCQSIT